MIWPVGWHEPQGLPRVFGFDRYGRYFIFAVRRINEKQKSCALVHIAKIMSCAFVPKPKPSLSVCFDDC